MGSSKTVSILQFGTTGQLGFELLRKAALRPGIALCALSRAEADFRRPRDIADRVRDAGPIDMVINTVAYTAVDAAEADEAMACTVNAETVAVLAQACREKGVPLIHVSTDYVFDGTKDAPYVETDATNALGAYGRTKLAGERAVRSALERHIIVRTSWVYSARGANFVRTMLRLGAERDTLPIVDNQYGAPTSAASLATAILNIAKQASREAPGTCFGTFHYTDRGETTWRRFAEAIFAEAAYWANIKAKIVPIATIEYPAPARRPSNSRLDCSKLERVYNMTRPTWQNSLADVLNEIKFAPRESG